MQAAIAAIVVLLAAATVTWRLLPTSWQLRWLLALRRHSPDSGWWPRRLDRAIAARTAGAGCNSCAGGTTSGKR